VTWEGGFTAVVSLNFTFVEIHLLYIRVALTFALEAKFEIEAKISFRLEAKKSLISHDSL
jgi:hypothetical protein